KLPGNLEGTPVTIGIIGDEDDFHQAWVPRMHAVGADLDRVKQIEPSEGLIELAADRDRLAAIVREYEIRLVFLDQLSDNVGAGTNDWHPKQLRGALAPARHLARELDCAVLGCLHPRKGASTSFREIVSGSHQYNAVSRSSLLLAEHPEVEDR